MIQTRASLRTRIKNAANANDAATGAQGMDARVNDIINEKLQEITALGDWQHLRSTFEFQTEDGTLGDGLVASMNQGSTTITLTTGTVTSAVIGMKIVVKPDRIAREILSIGGGGTTMVVDRAREGDDITLAGVVIFQDVYPIPTRCDQIINVQNLTVPKSEGEDGIIDLQDPREIHRSHGDTAETGEPERYTEEDDDVSAYSTGKAAMALAGTTITFSDGADTDDAELEEGMEIRIEEEVFTIKSVTDATHAETYQAAAAVHAATADYEIEVRIRQIRFNPAPLKIYTIQVPYYRREYGLHEDTAVWKGPEKFFSLLVNGAVAQLMAEMRDANPDGLAKFDRDYQRGLKASKTSNRTRRDDTERQVKPGMIGVYDPSVWSGHGG